MASRRGDRGGRRRGRDRRASALVIVLVALLLASICVVESIDGPGGPAPAAAAPTESPGQVVSLRPLSRSADLRIVDDLGRDVVLRGANVNSLGEYWQGDPGHAPTLPVTDADWTEMASRGLSVVRLIVTWSRLEPNPGQIDQAYLDLVDATVAQAASHGIYTVIDMHQDAYSPFVATTDPASCPPGTVPGKGWDGAPAWATLTDGASTCTTGDRYAAPAVFAAFNNFYGNTNGIRDHFVAVWGAVAQRFAGRPEVAGYDLLNEPPVTRPAAELQPLYDQLLVDTIGAIRNAEDAAPFDHLIFVEPALPMGDVSLGLVIPDPARVGLPPDNLVGAPHNYAESITIPGLDLTIDGLGDLYKGVTDQAKVALWIGEYGFWDTAPDTLAKVARYAAYEDLHALGGAWWQWRQSCGDPHHVQWDNGSVVVPAGPDTQLHRLGCPGNVDLGPTDEFLDVLGRGYPRAAPGRVTALHSDPVSDQLDVAGQAPVVGGQLVVWTPSSADAGHAISVEGLTDVVEHVVAGGRLLTATVSAVGCYAIHVDSTVVSCATATTTTTAGSSSVSAPSPVLANPRFTG